MAYDRPSRLRRSVSDAPLPRFAHPSWRVAGAARPADQLGATPEFAGPELNTNEFTAREFWARLGV